jgi:Immunoglobulin-like domain of bacterial spore germination
VSEHTELEDRLRTAVRAHAAGVQADDRSLDTIRTRVRTAKHRRRAVVVGAGIAAAVALAVAVPRLGDEGRIDTIDDPGPTTTVVPPSTTTPPGSASTTVAPPPPSIDIDEVLWPDPARELTADPVEAVRGFVGGPLGLSDPLLSPFRQTEPGAGEVDVFAQGESGQTVDRVASTVILRRLDGEHWFVTGAASPDVEIDTPEPLAIVSSPLDVAGRVRGYEGTVNVWMLDRFGGDRVDSDPAFGTGGSQELEPFSTQVSYLATGTQRGALYAEADRGSSTGIPSFTVFPVRFSTDGSDGLPAGSNRTAGAEFRYPPLWPFSSQAEVDAWRQQHEAQGSQPWHLDAEATALAFTTGYLGFGEIDQVVARDVRDREAWVSVGYDPGSGGLSTAAVVHLVRFGPGDDAPWEVVGTRDTDLTLDTPAYGSGVSTPVTVGGRITGVDESLRVQVRQASSETPIGEECCLPAGGDDTPWRATVSFSGATSPALTIVVSTGGHVQGVERFAITAVRP